MMMMTTSTGFPFVRLYRIAAAIFEPELVNAYVHGPRSRGTHQLAAPLHDVSKMTRNSSALIL